MLTTDQMSIITREVVAGVPAEKSKVPSSPEVDAFRATTEKEVAEAKAQGHDVLIPHEFPDLR